MVVRLLVKFLIYWAVLFFIGSHSQAIQTKIIPGVHLRGHWSALSDLSDNEFLVFEGTIEGYKARIIAGTKPYFKTVNPSSNDLFRAFADTFLQRAPVHWKIFSIQPEKMTTFKPDQFELKGFAQPAALGWIPLADEKKRNLLILTCIHENTPFYLLWYPPNDLLRDDAYQKVIGVFQF